MKPYYKQPKEDVLIVCPDKDGADYEFWMVKPVLIGTCQRLGDKRVAGGGRLFSNIRNVLRYFLEERGELDLANRMSSEGTKDGSLTAIGKDIVKKGNWILFCASRGINEDRFLSAPQTLYTLTFEEAQLIGMAAPPVSGEDEAV